jgi:hypothetical protein
MSAISRRGFLGSVAAGAAAWWGAPLKASQAEGAAARPKVALIHATDLFRPHADPDDHFDLATVYALAAQGRFELMAIMIDHPPAGLDADPDVQAVAQLNRITGLAVPVLTGSSRRLSPAEASRPENSREIAGVLALLRVMRASPLPVLISVVGSCRDVALAGLLDPKLFAAKCAGVYLNAGSGTSDRAKAARLEYNVHLDPASYAAIFDLPCPVYWLPCFEVAPGEGQPFAGGEFGTYYRFVQKDVLERLPPRLQNYFAFMFKQGDSDRAQQTEADELRPSWLRTLEGPVDMALLDRQGSRFRNMWCTAGFLHMAGLSVAGNGGPVEGGAEARNHAVYTFDPVKIHVGADGISEWSSDPRSRDRYLFHVRDPERYPAAMTAALGTLLSTLQ